ncbi:MAG: LemA family protein [Acidimicrobiia bacterium]|nr:LemA family protein [Acidimicrobiia bacterium]
MRRYAFAAVAALLLAVVAAGLVPLLAGWEEGDDLAHAWTRRGPVAIGAAGGVAALFLLTWLLLVYNGLVLVRNRVGRAWSLVAVQLQRRHALVPALTECARGYAQHEGELQELVTSARLGGAGPPPAGEEAPDATSVRAGTEAAQAQARAFEALVALAEGHPELRADTVFARLQDEIVDTEDRIALAREFFNDSVTIMRDRVRTFPGFLVARLGRFPTGELFAADGLERAVPRVEPVG